MTIHCALRSFTTLSTNFLLSLLGGAQKDNPFKDSYNFFLSQIRIRIEMTFGILCNKWRILQRPLQEKVKNAGKVFMCCARLHNYIINHEQLQGGDRRGNASIGSGNSSSDVDMNNDDADVNFLPSDVSIAPIAGNSIMRDLLVQRLQNLCLVRPQYNLERNTNR